MNIKIFFQTVLIIVLFFSVVYNLLLKSGFYNTNMISSYLTKISGIRKNIIDEIKNLDKSRWMEWPEKDLYAGDLKWHIIPIYGFGIWIPGIKNSCPQLCSFIKKIPGLKLAIISKLSPHTELIPHQGWGKHSNNVLRCHYGIDVPNDCFISVDNKKKYHKNDNWIIFDDSRTHSAGNKSDRDRTVLIIDIERPFWIPKGKSKVEFSQELQSVIDKFS